MKSETMKVNTNAPVNLQEDPEGSRKLFIPVFAPSSFVYSLLDFLSDPSPKLLISKQHLKKEQRFGAGDLVTYLILSLCNYENSGTCLVTCFSFLCLRFLLLYNGNYLYHTELPKTITRMPSECTCVDARTSVSFEGCSFPSTFWKGGRARGLVAKLQCQLLG